MRHYHAAQRHDGRWCFVQSRGDQIEREVGYCGPAMTEADYERLEKQIGYVVPQSERELYAKTAHKHHADGHATAAEACACYHEYQLDHSLQLNRVMSGQMQKCRVCGEWTQRYAQFGEARLYILCEKHNNRETVATLDKPSQEIWAS
jgi:hypothetical protein